MRPVGPSRAPRLWSTAALVLCLSSCSAGSTATAPQASSSVQQTTGRSLGAPAGVQASPQSDWLLLETPFGLETTRVGSGVSSTIVSKLDHDPHDASWSRGADRLVWVGYADDATQDVWIGDSGGKQARVLYDCVAPCKRAWSPQLSPDGDHVAANLDLGNRSQEVLVDVSTGDAVTLDLGGRRFDVSDWSPDGTHLLGTLLTVTGPHSVADRRYIASLDVTHARSGSKPEPRILVTADVPVWGAVWSPDGSSIAYVQAGRGTATDLYVLDTGDSWPHPVWQGSNADSVDSPAWSTDGRHVFVSHVLSSGVVALLARVDTSAGTLVELTDRLGGPVNARELDAG